MVNSTLAGLTPAPLRDGARPKSKRPLRYDPLARALHWLFAVGIIYATVVGYALHVIANPPLHAFLSQLNMSLATVLLGLYPLRLIWMQLRREPSPPRGIHKGQLAVAHAVHDLLYVCIGTVLLSGILMVPHGYLFFGIAHITTPFEQGPWTTLFFQIHRMACALLAALVLLHLVGVLSHVVIHRSNIVRRML